MWKPGVKAMIDKVLADNGNAASGEHLVDACLDQMGAIAVSDKTRSILTQFALQVHDVSTAEQARKKSPTCSGSRPQSRVPARVVSEQSASMAMRTISSRIA